MKQRSGWFALAIVAVLSLGVGCGGEMTPTPDASMPADMALQDMGSCVCTTVNPCCDGCMARDVGEWCVVSASSHSTSFGTCDASGSCSGEGSTCSHSQCQEATTDILPVCSVRSSAAGSPCDDGDPSTTGDQCDGMGTCEGT